MLLVPASLRCLFAVAVVRWAWRRFPSLKAHSALTAVTPAMFTTSLLSTLLLKLLPSRSSASRVVSALASLSEAVALTVGYPVSLNDGLEHSEDADWVALVAIFLGKVLGHRQAAVMLLLMVTGGELLEEHALTSASQSVNALLSWKANAPKRVTCLLTSATPGTDDFSSRSVASSTHEDNASRNVSVKTQDVQQLEEGSIVVVRVGEVIPIDGAILAIVPEGDFDVGAEEHSCFVRETALTGEIRPVLKNVGDTVLSGTLLAAVEGHNSSGHSTKATTTQEHAHTSWKSAGVRHAIVLRAACTIDKCTSALVSASWENALNEQKSRAKFEVASSRFAFWFTPFTFALGAVSALTMKAPQSHSTKAWEARLERFLCVLMAATPCPLTIGVPIAFIGAMSAAAKLGITFKRATAVEDLSAATTIVFDKTGTLTEPEIRVRQCVFHTQDDARDSKTNASFAAEVLNAVKEAEAGSAHPVGKSLFDFASSYAAQSLVYDTAMRSSQSSADDKLSSSSVHSMGVTRNVAGHEVLVGSMRYVAQQATSAITFFNSAEASDTSEHTSEMRVFVCYDNRHVATFVLHNAIRLGTPALLHSLQVNLGLKVAVLSGDGTENVRKIVKNIVSQGSPELQEAFATGKMEVVGGCLPQDKVAYINGLRRRGEVVVMVGDGLNDAPALTAANVGIALEACAHGLATESADAALLSNDMACIAKVVSISRNAVKCARHVAGGGMGASLVQMICAATGLLSPLTNSILQEVIDLSAIAKALTVLFYRP